MNESAASIPLLQGVAGQGGAGAFRAGWRYRGAKVLHNEVGSAAGRRTQCRQRADGNRNFYTAFWICSMPHRACPAGPAAAQVGNGDESGGDVLARVPKEDRPRPGGKGEALLPAGTGQCRITGCHDPERLVMTNSETASSFPSTVVTWRARTSSRDRQVKVNSWRTRLLSSVSSPISIMAALSFHSPLNAITAYREFTQQTWIFRSL